MSDIMGTWELVHLTDNVAGQTWTFTNDSIPTVTVDYEMQDLFPIRTLLLWKITNIIFLWTILIDISLMENILL